ncbi:hypothetical protein Micbo1qcDRAFT_236116 [Microdochium bolleyi]|uniref:Uncharacterized protein n=1 Tax=Microdochium bolleyi TaxID=196109 RepID=A0A136ISR3_9PEZI|nr:hypothetical protein Micbo1qcDRAFT_236116 [Microdochium bolleyi]
MDVLGLTSTVPSATQTPIPVHSRLLRRFSEAVIFEEALSTACQKDPVSLGKAPVEPHVDPSDDAERAFKSYVNKLAHVCDKRRGGTTVTGIAILQDAEHIYYFIGSNKRSTADLAQMEEFLHPLFRLVQSPQPCSADNASFFASILHHIIRFNRRRIQTYLNQLYKHIGLCVSSLESEHVQASWTVKSGQLKTSLIELGSRISRLESKTLPENGEEEISSLADIIMFIHDMHIRGHGERSRLRAYHVSTQSIISAHNCWPHLFEDVRIVTVPSSTPYLNPLIKGKTVTASQMLGRMVAPTEIELRRAEAKQLERFGLDNIFHTACNAESFTPLVHGEVLVHDFVSTYLLENPDTSYCHGLRYVGSSKPTCRLCSYYFYEVGDVGVRESHGNLYSRWRAPDVFDEEAAKRRDGILNAMVEMIRKDALRTLSSKLPRGLQRKLQLLPCQLII